MTHIKKLFILAGAAVGAAGFATAGFAYWSAHGSGTGTATLGTWKSNTTTAVVSGANPSVVGQQVTYTANASATGSGAPTGNVEFFEGATPLTGCGGTSGNALTGSSASCVQTYSAPGSHTIKAKYLGDANYNASPLSSGVAQVVNQASTSTSLSVSGSPAVYGSENAVLFTSSVTPAFSGTPSGTVTIKQATTTLCSITIPATTCSPGTTALNANATPYGITAVYGGDSNFVGSTSSPSQNLSVAKAMPVVNWPSPTAITYGAALGSTQLNATANVPGIFVYTQPAGTVLPAGTQLLSLTFTPTDTTNYSATTAGVTITVNKATPTITWATPAAITYGTALSATQLNATASVAGTQFVYSPASGTVLGAGTRSLAVTFTPTDTANYNSATGSVNLTVIKATPSITWATPAAITYGTALSATQLNATASVAGTQFVYSPASGTVLGAGTRSLGVTFTPTDTANYNVNVASVNVTVNKAPLTITASNGTMTAGGTVPTIAASYSGFLNGDVASSLSTQPTCSTTATSSSAAGSYASSCSGAVSSNYTVTYVNGTVTVNSPSPTITSPTSGSPLSVPNNTTQNITVTGTNFASGTTVSIGSGFTVNSVTVVSSTQLTVSVTAKNGNGNKGSYDLTVTSSGTSVTSQTSIKNV